VRSVTREPVDSARDAAPAAWSALADALIDAVWLVDAAQLTVVHANAAAGRLLGLPSEALRGRHVVTLAATPEDLAFWADVESHGAQGLWSETWVRRCDGALVAVTRRVSPVVIDGGSPLYLVALHDRSEQCQAEREREGVIADLRATLESTADGILVTDLAGGIRAFNERFASLWNMPPELLQRRDDAAVRACMRRSVADAAAYGERLAAIEEAALLQTSDLIELHGGRVLERVTLPQLTGGEPVGRVYSFRDVSERLAARRRIEELAYTDTLTGLPNRALLADRFAHALAVGQREGTPFATLLVDLDRFKQLNDTFGQPFGDRVLVEVAQRLKACMRQVDTLARLSGDQFVLLVHGAQRRGAEVAAGRLLEAMRRPFSLDGVTFTVTCSIGIALHPHDGADMDELLRSADAATHSVKESGRADFRFYEPRNDGDRRARIRMDHAMRQGLARGDFRLRYQPQIDLASGGVIGCEALLRWTDGEFGEVSPAAFIPVAEDSGFIVPVGEWVLVEAVRQAADWRARGVLLPVSINVSALQFQQHNFVDRVAAVLRAAHLPPELLELELTESILLRDADEALQRLRALDALGVRMSIDDFGTGYSSLGYLKRFPIRRLKIDRSFVSGVPGDDIDEGIAQAIINLGRALKLQVVAEGVETQAQRRFLKQAGCDHFQGFLCAPALDSKALMQMVKARSGRVLARA
jgi:diguanylate cyclase (GGDEF)-like protein/PAS domain S-box-containing protein